MDLARKIELANQAVDSISRHRDEDAAVRRAMLEQVRLHIADELDAIDAEVDARTKALLAPRAADASA